MANLVVGPLVAINDGGGMTVEHRWYLELPEIIAVRFECKGCGATLGFPANNWKQLTPVKCKNCDREWMMTGSTVERALRSFGESLERLRDEKDALGCRVSLEFDGRTVAEGKQ
jgi:hypothetical protein